MTSLVTLLFARLACQQVGLNRYKYVGKHHLLIGETALCRMNKGKFEFQIDKLSHPFSIGWHEDSLANWVQL